MRRARDNQEPAAVPGFPRPGRSATRALDRVRAGTPLAHAAGMEKTWKAPEFEEIHLGSEMETEDDGDPSLVFTAKTVVRGRPIAVERRLQRSRGAGRGRS